LNKERAKVREKSEEVGLGVLKWGEGDFAECFVVPWYFGMPGYSKVLGNWFDSWFLEIYQHQFIITYIHTLIIFNKSELSSFRVC